MSVVGTKLRAPVPRRRLVPRERLVVRLQADPTTMPRLVIISAPAGFGKTTLLTRWLTPGRAEGPADGRTSQALRVGWLSLDKSDADPGVFLTHLVAALQLANSPKFMIRSTPRRSRSLFAALVTVPQAIELHGLASARWRDEHTHA